MDETTMVETSNAAPIPYRMTRADALVVTESATNAIRKAFASAGRVCPEDMQGDLINDTVIRVIESFNPDKGVLGALAYRTAYNQAIDFLRGRGHAGARNAHESSMATTEDDEGHVCDVEIASNMPNPEDLLAIKQREEYLMDEINGLTPSQRDALLTSLESDDNLTGSVRVNKMRAVDTIVKNLPRSMRGDGSGRSKNKGRKRK